MDILIEYVLYADIDGKINTRDVNCSSLVLAGTSMGRRTGGSTTIHYTLLYAEELGYNVMKGAEYVLSSTSVVLTEKYIAVNTNRCRYNRVRM